MEMTPLSVEEWNREIMAKISILLDLFQLTMIYEIQ
jgi:hypothetical protein